MKYQIPQFKFIDRGFNKDMLLIPGWATDWRIFEKLDIPFNYILPEDMLPARFESMFDSLLDMIEPSGISVLGWSMGGFIAADLVSRYPRVFDKAVLVGIRRRYNENDINHVSACLKKNTRAYLYKFYKSLFSEPEKSRESWFKESLLKKYLEDSDSLHLSDGLDYLANRELKVDSLDSSRTIFIHGENDIIASLEEARLLVANMPLARFIPIRSACHFPILRDEFRDIFRKETYAR